MVDTQTTPRLLADGQIDPAPIITHRFGLAEMVHAYDVFGRPDDSGALKVLQQRTA
jgi:alcohol dehydrogenase